jgi:serpin B
VTDDERFTVNPDFLQLNADYYGADVYRAPFDAQLLRDINNWAKLKTDGMIPKVIEEMSPYAIMYLVNALAFEAEWMKTYERYQVRDGKFTAEDGDREDVKLMYCDEHVYLEDELATGFVKYYKGREYAFVALLPNEGVTVSDYLASLDGESLSKLLSAPEYRTVKTAIPKFEVEFDTEMSGILYEMGIRDAFDPDNADFSSLGSSTEDNIFINRVIHKTFIEVSELGTRAGASTVIECKPECAPMEPKYVYLDRPFVYMIIDCDNNVPFFIGTYMG